MDYNNNGELFDYIVAKTKQTFFFFCEQDNKQIRR